MAKTLEELPVYAKAQELWRAVSAILKNPRLVRNQRLWKQIDEANDSIIANMQEGFEQPTDAAFANYLFTAKASMKEVIARLRQARAKDYITKEDLERCEEMANDLGAMLGGFIRYLHRSNFKDRGRFRERQEQKPDTNEPDSSAPGPASDSSADDKGYRIEDRGSRIEDRGSRMED